MLPRLTITAFLLLLSSTVSVAQSLSGKIPLNIIIDDMGNNYKQGLRALELPGVITYSFLPHTPHAKKLAELAHGKQKSVLLHLPMQGSQRRTEEALSLKHTMDEQEFKTLLSHHLQAVPYIRGINNHMGSEITPLRQPMDWLMSELAARKLFFIDSRTTHLTVASQSAKRFNVSFDQRDVFLDNEKTIESITASFKRFLQLAQQRNGAIAIGHPHPITIKTLTSLLSSLDHNKYVLVNSAAMVKLQRQKNRHMVALDF